MKNLLYLKSVLVIILSLMLISSCIETISVQECLEEDMLGFWPGLWHGFILPISFIWSLFDDDVAIYAINNNGNWYNFGYLLGAATILGGSSRAKRK